MEERTRGFLNGIDRWIATTMEIDSLEVSGDLARAVVRQHADRMAWRPDIQAITYPSDSEAAVIVLQKYDRDQAPLEDPQHAHRIQTSAVQREIWRKTASGLKIHKIEEILVGPVLIDGKPMR